MKKPIFKSLKEFIGCHVSEFLLPSDYESFRVAVKKLHITKEPQFFSYSIIGMPFMAIVDMNQDDEILRVHETDYHPDRNERARLKRLLLASTNSLYYQYHGMAGA